MGFLAGLVAVGFIVRLVAVGMMRLGGVLVMDGLVGIVVLVLVGRRVLVGSRVLVSWVIISVGVCSMSMIWLRLGCWVGSGGGGSGRQEPRTARRRQAPMVEADMMRRFFGVSFLGI